ncbi:unnamed protein product [Sphagnum compactum]
MGNPSSPSSELQKKTTVVTPSKRSHRHHHYHRRAPSVTSLSPGDNTQGKGVAASSSSSSPERTNNGAARSGASSNNNTPSPGAGGGGSGEKGNNSMLPAAGAATKDGKVVRRRSRSSLGGADEFVRGIDFNAAAAATPPAAEDNKKTIISPTVEEKKHPFLLARVIRVNAGGIGRNGVRIGTPSQSLQSPQGTKQQQRLSTPPGKEKTPALLVQGGGGGAGSASLTPSSKKAETTSRKAEKELSLAAAENATTAKPVRGAQGGHSISIGQHHKQNGSSPTVLLATSEKFKVAGDDDDSCSLTSSDMSTTPLQPDLERSSISQPLAHEGLTRSEILVSIELPVYHEGETTAEELISNEVNQVQDDQLHLPIEDAEEKTSTASTELSSSSLDYAEQQEGLQNADSGERKLALPTLRSSSSQLACEPQGWNEMNVEEPTASAAMKDMQTHQPSTDMGGTQGNQVDLQIAEIGESSSTPAISSESPSPNLLCAEAAEEEEEEAFTTAATSEELSLSTEKNLLIGFPSEDLSSHLSHTSMNQGKYDGMTAEQEVLELSSDTSLESSIRPDVSEDHGRSGNLNTSSFLVMELMPDSGCSSAQDSVTVGDDSQELIAATTQNTMAYPSKNLESPAIFLDLEEAVGTHSESAATFSPGTLQESIVFPDNDQETNKNTVSLSHGLLTASLDSYHDLPSEQLATSPNSKQGTDIQAGTSVTPQQALEPDLEQPPSANREEFLVLEQEPGLEETSTNVFVLPSTHSLNPVHLDEESLAVLASSQKSPTLDRSVETGSVAVDSNQDPPVSTLMTDFLASSSAKSVNADLVEGAVIKDGDNQFSANRRLDMNRIVETMESENRMSPTIREVLEVVTNAPGSCAEEEATDGVDKGSMACLLQETSLNLLEMGVSASLILAEDVVVKETKSAAVQNNWMMPGDEGGHTKKLPLDTGIGRGTIPVTENAHHHLHFDIQDEAVAAILHEDLGADDKTSSTTIVHDLPVHEGSQGNTIKKLEDLEMAAAHGVAPTLPLEPAETTKPMHGAESDTFSEREPGPASLRGHLIYDDTSEAAEELDRSNNVSDGSFDMAEDERVAETVMGEVNLRKQEEDIAGESAAAAAHMSPLFETRPAPTLQHKPAFPAEEPKLEEIEGQGLHLNCLDELCRSLEAENCDTVISVGTLDISEGLLLPERNLEMPGDDRSETEVNEKEQRPCEEQTMTLAADTNHPVASKQMLDNAGDYPVKTSEKQEDESSGDTSAEASLNFNPSHAPTMQDNFVVPAKELMTVDGVGEDVHLTVPILPLSVASDNEVEQLDYDNYPVSSNGTCNATEQLEELAKTEGLQGVNDLDEEKTSLATGEGTSLNSCMKTLHAPSMQESCAYQAQKTAAEKDSGESVDLQSRHILLGTSPAATGDNEEETTSGQADRSSDGASIDLESLPETNEDNVDLNKPSNDHVRCNGVQAQQADLVKERAILDVREPCKNHSQDTNESEITDMSNEAPLPLTCSNQLKENTCEVSHASSTDVTDDEVPTSDQTGLQTHLSSDVMQIQTADHNHSSVSLKALPLLQKPMLITNGHSLETMLQASNPETAENHEPTSTTMFSVLGQHHCSSSQQDHLWEEQAEAYSSGGRGTPARLEVLTTNGFHSPSPGPAATSLDDQILPASGPIKDSIQDAMASCSRVENGSTSGRGNSGRSHTPLRSLLAEDASKRAISTGPGSSPLKRLFSRIMRTPPRMGDSDVKQVKNKNKSVWNTCLGGSAVQ